jgi:hypothetical protein
MYIKRYMAEVKDETTQNEAYLYARILKVSTKYQNVWLG